MIPLFVLVKDRRSVRPWPQMGPGVNSGGGCSVRMQLGWGSWQPWSFLMPSFAQVPRWGFLRTSP